MTTAPSNPSRPRRNEEMKFAYAGPFVTLLDPIRPVKPERGPSGIVLSRQPRYAADSAESYDIGSRVGRGLEIALGVMFGSNAVVTNRPKQRRRGGRGRKPVTS